MEGLEVKLLGHQWRCPRSLLTTDYWHASTDPPVVTLSAEPQTVQEGEKVSFLCQAMAQPPVTGYR